MRKKFSHIGFVRRSNRQGEPVWGLNTEKMKCAEGDSAALRFLYRTAPGRMLLKLLIQPEVSKAAGYYLSSRASKWLVPYYIQKHGIAMNDIEIPKEGFASFNDFFTRKRKAEPFGRTDGYLVSPCDGWLSVEKIKKDTVFEIKASRFTLRDLLNNDQLADEFQDGSALIFRLTPADYHRYCYAADGRIAAGRRINGKLHCVRPIALRQFPVFAQNSREYQVIRTQNFGLMVQMEIGALLVGKIRNHAPISSLNDVQAGAEKGYFEFGGSTILLLLRKDAVRFLEKPGRIKNSAGEIKVRMGEQIAKRNGIGGNSGRITV